MAELHVFIDANAWLAFYSFTNDDLEQLRKLIALIKKGKLKLYIDQQLVDEFYRNREKKLEASLREFSKTPIPKSVPRYMSDYPEATKFVEAVTEADKLRQALMANTRKEAQAKELAADKLFEDILKEVTLNTVDGTILGKAMERRLKGNPPGFYPSAGDQIHWEVLLRDVPDSADLHVISKDGDFESKLNKGLADQFLIDEWWSKKKARLTLHNELRPFFNSMFPDIKLAVDVEKKDAIDKLIYSGSFVATHYAIASLELIKDEISWADADSIFVAALGNSQIKWIGTDPDVSSFYLFLIKKFSQQLGPQRWLIPLSQMNKMLNQVNRSLG